MSDENNKESVKCDGCHGNGNCSKCHGSGKAYYLIRPPDECSRCEGTGVCPGCSGSGWIVPGRIR